jgi:hypothetical protein
VSASRNALAALTVGAFVAGIAVGLLVHRPPAGDLARSAASVDPGALAEQLERIDRRLSLIEQNGHGASDAASIAAGARPAVGPPPAVSTATANPEQQRAAESADGIVQRALGSRSLTRQDAAEFAAAAAGMRDADRLELRRQLASAINDDRVTVEPGAELML